MAALTVRVLNECPPSSGLSPVCRTRVWRRFLWAWLWVVTWACLTCTQASWHSVWGACWQSCTRDSSALSGFFRKEPMLQRPTRLLHQVRLHKDVDLRWAVQLHLNLPGRRKNFQTNMNLTKKKKIHEQLVFGRSCSDIEVTINAGFMLIFILLKSFDLSSEECGGRRPKGGKTKPNCIVRVCLFAFILCTRLRSLTLVRPYGRFCLFHLKYFFF